MLQGAPSIAPVWANWLGQEVSWRWILYVIAIFAALDLVLLCFIPETQPGIILRNHARALRREHGVDKASSRALPGAAFMRRSLLARDDERAAARRRRPHLNEKLTALQGRVYAHVEFDQRPLWRQITSTLARPLVMLFTEPMLLSTTIYHAFIYSLLFMLLEIVSTARGS